MTPVIGAIAPKARVANPFSISWSTMIRMRVASRFGLKFRESTILDEVNAARLTGRDDGAQRFVRELPWPRVGECAK